jgi:hypothetical protein
MSESSEAGEQAIAGKQTIKLVLNAGSGPRSSSGLHQMFAKPGWHEVRINIDHQANPDLVGSIVDMTSLIARRQRPLTYAKAGKESHDRQQRGRSLRRDY